MFPVTLSRFARIMRCVLSLKKSLNNMLRIYNIAGQAKGLL